MKRIVPAVFIAITALCVWLIMSHDGENNDKINIIPQTKIIAPLTSGIKDDIEPLEEQENLLVDELLSPKVSLESDEQIVSIITQDLYGDQMDEQVLSVRNPDQLDGQIYIILVEYDEYSNGYRRLDKVATGITRPRTYSVFTRDLLGDRSNCLIATGMNSTGEQVMTAFLMRKSIVSGSQNLSNLHKILSLTTDGSIAIQEKERNYAYLQGMSHGDSFNVSTFSRDTESANVLDQIETMYSWEPATNRYERSGTARIAGVQIEQKMLNEILDGTVERFEDFLSGMWTKIEHDGPTTDLASDNLYFDKHRQELVFLTEESQEVYEWINVTPLRYGLYLSTKNLSIPTLRRLISIELHSMDSIRIRVREDVRIKLGFGGQWEALYKKMVTGSLTAKDGEEKRQTEILGSFKNEINKLTLTGDKQYVFFNKDSKKEGVFSTFTLGSLFIVEFRPALEENEQRMAYSVEYAKEDDEMALVLHPVKLGINGTERLYERPLKFIKDDEFHR